MRHLAVRLFFSVGLGLMVSGAVVFLTTSPKSAEAQCGGGESSCVSCHETEGRLPVWAEGQWHIDHRSEAFCMPCHGGNPQALTKDNSHEGRVDPLGNGGVQCVACHTGDFEQRIQDYSDLLMSVPAESDADFWGSDSSATTTESDADFWGDDSGTTAAQPVESALVVEQNEDEGDPYGWNNTALAGIAGFLTALTGMVVFQFERPGKGQS